MTEHRIHRASTETAVDRIPWTPVRRRRWAWVLVAALGLPAASARPQSPAAPASPARAVDATASCRLPLESWVGAFDLVGQSLTAADTASVVTGELPRLNRRIAEAAREALGGSEAAVPRADTLGGLDGEVAVPLLIVLHRDAPATWHIAPSADSAGARVAKFYNVVLGGMAPNDQRMPWPTTARSDSAVVRVWLSTQHFGQLDLERPAPNAVLIFKALHPMDPNGPPVVAHGGSFLPSSHVMDAGIAWRVVMEGTIDPDGKLEKHTIQDIRSLATASDSAHFKDYYKQVVDAARDAMLHSIYEPAHRGGCAVEQVIRQSFFVNSTGKR